MQMRTVTVNGEKSGNLKVTNHIRDFLLLVKYGRVLCNV